MKPYSKVEIDLHEDDTTNILRPSLKYDYTSLDNKYINVGELLETLNKIEHITELWTLIHELTKPIPGSE